MASCILSPNLIASLSMPEVGRSSPSDIPVMPERIPHPMPAIAANMRTGLSLPIARRVQVDNKMSVSDMDDARNASKQNDAPA